LTISNFIDLIDIMERDDLVSASRLLVAAGYASQTGVVGEAFQFEMTQLGYIRFLRLGVRLPLLPPLDSPERQSALLKIFPEMEVLSPSPTDLEALVAMAMLYCKTPHKPL
jgi:hypothetical protein